MDPLIADLVDGLEAQIAALRAQVQTLKRLCDPPVPAGSMPAVSVGSAPCPHPVTIVSTAFDRPDERLCTQCGAVLDGPA